MAYLQCPECRLTVPARAYVMRGDECPRCRTAMEPLAAIAPRRFERAPRLPDRMVTPERPGSDPRLGA